MKKNILKNAIIVYIISSIVFILIGYIFNIDMLKIYRINMDKKFSIISLSYSGDIAIIYYFMAYSLKEKDKNKLKFSRVFWITYIFLNLIGYIFKIPALRRVWYYNDGDSMTLSSGSILISVFVSICYYLIDTKIINKNKSK